jgi:twitching motility protein PilT
MASIDYKRELEDLIEIVIAENGSDIHFSVGSNPIIRVAGSLIPLIKKPVLTQEDNEGFMHVLLSPDQEKEFLEKREVDFSYAGKDGSRFRGNGFYQRGAISMALRYIPNVVRTLADLNLPPILETFTQRPQGFFLCVGPVGQGKSTTLAAMIELINQSRAEHIVTIEDPIEYR